MRSYVGQDVRNVMLAYGPPASELEMGNGERAFQWLRIDTSTSPMTATTTTRKKGKTADTVITGGDTTTTRCVYTFFTHWDASRQAWIVTGYKEPSFDCAVGDLSRAGDPFASDRRSGTRS